MMCETKYGGCFKTECVRKKVCQEKISEANYEVTVIVKKTYRVLADSDQESINMVIGACKFPTAPMPIKIEVVNIFSTKLI